jgi:two-component system LytT family response regulator
MYKAAIIEDETLYSDMVCRLLADFFPEILVAGIADNVADGVKLIENEVPDLVFMDIELKDGNSFHLLRQLHSANFQLIFITAFNEYAITAFKFSAIDYLLKPVNPYEFQSAVERALENLSKKSYQHYHTMLDNLSESMGDKKLVLKTSDKIHIVTASEIVRCEADNCYTTFFLESGESILVSRGIREFEELLTKFGFFKPHQSHLINLKYLRKVDKSDGGFLILSNNCKVPLATRKKQELLELLKKY